MKLKTHSGAKKRFKKSGKKSKNGQPLIIGAKSCRRHLLTNKSKGQKKIKEITVAKGDGKNIKKLMPN